MELSNFIKSRAVMDDPYSDLSTRGLYCYSYSSNILIDPSELPIAIRSSNTAIAWGTP
jgi:hypothetical protein